MNHLEKWLNLNAPPRTFGKESQDLVKTKPKKVHLLKTVKCHENYN